MAGPLLGTVRGAVNNSRRKAKYLRAALARIAAAKDDPDVYMRVSHLGQRHIGLSRSSSLTPFEYRVFSQNGEDGVLAEILNRIGCEASFFVEIGAGAGTEANCVFLADVLGWSGLFVEADPPQFEALASKYEDSSAVTCEQAFVTAAEAEAILSAAGVPEKFDVLSIDIDGNDYWVWRALERHRPRVVVVEYNGTISLAERKVQPNDPTLLWNGSDFFGASLGALEELANAKGYKLAYTDLAGVNAFFVDSEVFDRLSVDFVPRRAANYGLVGRRPPRNQTNLDYITPGVA